MFGELDDSNIYESFDAFSDGEPNNTGSEFSFGDSSDTQGDVPNDDFLDMSSFAEPSVQENEVYNEGAPASFQGDDQFDYEQAAQSQAQSQHQPAKKGGGGFFVVLLLIIAIAAGGLFYYKKFMTPAPSQEATSGDYFYDQAAQQGAAPTEQEQAANTTTVDVNLNSEPTDVASADSAANAQNQENPESLSGKDRLEKLEAIAEDKTLSPKERAEYKKKMDAKREKQVGLGLNNVTIQVSDDGRGDPFLPLSDRVAIASAPKFDLIAPPPEVPVSDPVVDQVSQTKISGIMYDSSRPSAIVNIGGTDHLVHKGDNVNGFQVLGITQNSVTIKYGTNIYQATVGEEVGGNVQLNPVSNLSNQFGGAYKKTPKNAIQF